ncbi:MAG: XRE family transcriptional regulator, partial [Proteobacteria bacterium]
MNTDLESAAGRLRWAREMAGFRDQADFARATNIKDVTYRAYENGQNGFANDMCEYERNTEINEIGPPRSPKRRKDFDCRIGFGN